MKLIHLSHTDLDGYGCQFISNKYFNDIDYINANYGLEVDTAIRYIIETTQYLDTKDEILILITDLNLNRNEAKILNRHVDNLSRRGIDIKIQLLDHHKSGEDVSKLYGWYFLDTSRCATKITYDFFKAHFETKDNFDIDEISTLVNSINAVDIWLEDSNLFEFGKVCMKMMNESREIAPAFFPNEDRAYKFQLLEWAKNYLDKPNANILLDDDFYMLKKRYLSKNSEKDTLDNLASRRLVDLLSSKKDDLTLYYKGHKGLLTFAIGSISILANKFLKSNPDYSFFIDVGKRGTVSLRGNGTIDVSKVAHEIADGGGHPNASGGKISDFKEKVFYKDIKKGMKSIFEEKEILFRNRNIDIH